MCIGGSDTPDRETEDDKVAAEIANERYQYYQDRLVPVQNEYIADVRSLNDDSQYERVAGDTNAEFTQAFSSINDENHRALSSQGIDPNSGQAINVHSSTAAQQGQNQADAINRGQVDNQNSYVGGLQNIVALGEGQATSAQQGLQDIAANSAEVAANAAANNSYNRQQNNELASTGFGFAAETLRSGG
ncbi:hypothetical protein J7384_17775 [Endozoicomonas sp. G2_1]|uniref:hypothetical protein n=1 Tax=Endozoicomonas sp. G2_1 TaxID=2821091 RepID=UPI001ADB8BFE|nr:hypothetical protein [Endozoicomonas sp. G2_1]MBO9492215.1 hypothetical protein [Endozoicomonas sp. G2_1]